MFKNTPLSLFKNYFKKVLIKILLLKILYQCKYEISDLLFVDMAKRQVLDLTINLTITV